MDEDLLGGFRLMVVVGSFHKRTVHERGADADERDQVWAVDRAPRSWAASMSLNAMANPATREPGPRVIFVRCLTVANVDSIGFVVRR